MAEELERVPQGTDLHVDFEELDYIDHACLELLMTWSKQHEATGGRLTIDWTSLHTRFTRNYDVKEKRRPNQPVPDVESTGE